MFIRIAQIAISFALLAGSASAQDGPASAYWSAQKGAAIHDLVSGFNQLGSRAGHLRAAMSQPDAEAFDAVMLDMMRALASFPEIAWKEKPTAGVIRPAETRPDRIPQLKPEVEALVHFFERLKKSAPDRSSQKLFAGAEISARKMAAALPNALPTLSSR